MDLNGKFTFLNSISIRQQKFSDSHRAGEMSLYRAQIYTNIGNWKQYRLQ